FVRINHRCPRGQQGLCDCPVVDRLLKRIRDQALILMIYRHGLRVSEAVKCAQSARRQALHRWVERLKDSLTFEQPVSGDELRAINDTLLAAPTICPGPSMCANPGSQRLLVPVNIHPPLAPS